MISMHYRGNAARRRMRDWIANKKLELQDRMKELIDEKLKLAMAANAPA